MTKNLNCIIVDDDGMSLKILQTLVERTEFLDLKGAFSSSVEAAHAIRRMKIDLIFLDIEMPDMTGLEFIKALDQKPQIIIVSSKDKYARDAFDYDVVDYLLKPIDNYPRFLKAVFKAKDNIDTNTQLGKGGNDNIFIKVDSLYVNFSLSDILWVEAYGDYVKIHTNQKTHTVYSTLKSIEGKLPSEDFVRIHRSYIVRMDKIKNIDLSNLQIEDHILPISNSYKPELMERIRTL